MLLSKINKQYTFRESSQDVPINRANCCFFVFPSIEQQTLLSLVRTLRSNWYCLSGVKKKSVAQIPEMLIGKPHPLTNIANGKINGITDGKQLFYQPRTLMADIQQKYTESILFFLSLFLTLSHMIYWLFVGHWTLFHIDDYYRRLLHCAVSSTFRQVHANRNLNRWGFECDRSLFEPPVYRCYRHSHKTSGVWNRKLNRTEIDKK